MSFDLEFREYPGAGGPFSYALVPWDTDLFGMPFYELQCSASATPDEIGKALPGWRDTVRAMPAMAFTRVSPADIALAEVLCAAGSILGRPLSTFQCRCGASPAFMRTPAAAHDFARLASPTYRERSIAARPFSRGSVSP